MQSHSSNLQPIDVGEYQQSEEYPDFRDCGESEITLEGYTQGALFCGIGGFCQGFMSKGAKNVFANELDGPTGRAYLNAVHCESFIPKNICDLRANELPNVDILHGGFPCQSFSIAGAQGGFHDTKGNGKLFFEIIRLLKEYGETKRPKVLVFENTANLRYGNAGNWLYRIRHELNKLDYWCSEENCINLNVLKHTGIPQNRDRLFIFAIDSNIYDYNPFIAKMFTAQPRDRLDAFLLLDEQAPDNFYLDPSNRYFQEMSACRVTEEHGDDTQLYHYRKYETRLPERGICPTLTANMGRGGHNVPFLFDQWGLRKLTPRECLNLQGFPPEFKFPEGMSYTSQYAMIGNSVSPKIAKLLARRVSWFFDRYGHGH
ncbi:MAG: hypothetical protein CMD99_08430 [Gammaproteobacteria bacterium]|nr:hypothetical protein [Gammaproteobacteria bacterium]